MLDAVVVPAQRGQVVLGRRPRPPCGQDRSSRPGAGIPGSGTCRRPVRPGDAGRGERRRRYGHGRGPPPIPDGSAPGARPHPGGRLTRHVRADRPVAGQQRDTATGRPRPGSSAGQHRHRDRDTHLCPNTAREAWLVRQDAAQQQVRQHIGRSSPAERGSASSGPSSRGRQAGPRRSGTGTSSRSRAARSSSLPCTASATRASSSACKQAVPSGAGSTHTVRFFRTVRRLAPRRPRRARPAVRGPPAAVARPWRAAPAPAARRPGGRRPRRAAERTPRRSRSVLR